MDTEEFIEALDGMPSDEVAQHFEALMCLALSIEEREGSEKEEEVTA